MECFADKLEQIVVSEVEVLVAKAWDDCKAKPITLQTLDTAVEQACNDANSSRNISSLPAKFTARIHYHGIELPMVFSCTMDYATAFFWAKVKSLGLVRKKLKYLWVEKDIVKANFADDSSSAIDESVWCASRKCRDTAASLLLGKPSEIDIKDFL